MTLLGAGASVDAGLPTTARLTDLILDSLDRNAAAIAFYVHGVLQAELGRKGIDPRGPISAERLAAAIDLLAQRDELPISPFVRSWDPAIDGLDAGPKRRIPEGDIERAITDMMKGAVGPLASTVDEVVRLLGSPGRLARGSTSIQSKVGSYNASDLASAIMRIAGDSDGARRGEFRRTAKELSRCLPTVLSTPDTDSASYLDDLIRCSGTNSPLAVATLNYDRLVEERCDHAQVKYSTGIETWTQSHGLDFGQADVKLYKLHGSIDWQRHRERIDVVPGGKQPPDFTPELIFGEGAKLQADGPFLELYDAFRISLRDTAQLLVIGYSFQDEHINVVIRRWLGSERSNRIVLVTPGDPFSVGPRPSSLRRDLGINYGEDDRIVHVKATAREGIRDALDHLQVHNS
jgi:hypothetical protein